MRHFSFLEKILIYILSPIAIIYANVNSNLIGAQSNCIANHIKPTGNKVACFGKDISFKRVSEKTKEMKITINDFLLGITSVSIKEYMVSKGDDKTSEIVIGLPFTLRDPILRKHGFTFQNDFVSIPLALSL